METNVLLQKVEEFIEKAREHKGYFTKVILNKEAVPINILMPFEEILEQQNKNSLSLYPPDTGIISESNLLEGFEMLKGIFADYQQNNVDKIRLIYM